MPLVSILTPTYNHENYIGKCIESVLSQTFEDWEMIIIDDGSTDRTFEVAGKYDDDRIRCFRQGRKGKWKIFETYNKALRLARGKYIAILDGDDYWPAYKLEKQLPTLDDENVVLSFGKWIEVDAKGEKLCSRWRRDIDFTKDTYLNKPRGSLIKEIILHGGFISSNTVICRKDSLIQIGGFKQPPGLTCWDLSTWLALSLTGEFSATNEVLGYYRRHSTQISQTCYDDIRVWKMYTQFFEDFYDGLPLEIKSRLDINKRMIQRNLEKAYGGRYVAIGRNNLLNQNWSRARRNFVIAIKKARFRAKLLALLGLGFSLVKKDLESICKMLGLSRLR